MWTTDWWTAAASADTRFARLQLAARAVQSAFRNPQSEIYKPPAAPRPDQYRDARRDEDVVWPNAGVSCTRRCPMDYGQVLQDQVAFWYVQPD